ncbi:MAG: glycoside hydrolase family 13 protein [Mariniphaga sp.]|nr:glycoside hydrolase family 13 protein [Mariniphaga sp.]
MNIKQLTIKTVALFAIVLLTVISIQAANKPTLNRVEPPFWWTGFKNPSLQLMVYGERISETKPEIKYEGVELVTSSAVENPNYLFLDLRLSPNVKPGKFEITFKQNGKTIVTTTYELKAREKNSSQRVGFNTTDVMYLIMPDRFVNGDPSNDSMPESLEKANRANPDGRHGGDLKGIQDHLDYIKDNGYTAIWVNPVLENNMPDISYHGYSTTDFYKVDSRFGTNADYQTLSAEAKKKGIKMVMDMIFNHCGSSHWWMKDMPMKDWINEYPAYKITNHKKATVQDPYGSEIDSKEFTDGWFVPTMPDLNQRNPYMANYLIQNSIWWIEHVGLDGIRMDTYPYPDKQMMSDWTKKVMDEYPNFNIVGEEWNTNPAAVAFWQKGKTNPNGYTSYLPSLMDFPTQNAIVQSMNENDGLNRLYETLALDYLYPKADNLVTFAENHDTERFFSAIGENIPKYKTAMTFLMTTRGIPQVYYGSEILMTGFKRDGDGALRKDFPGGWQGDQINGFKGVGLTAAQLDVQQFMKKLVNWRKGKDVIHNGLLKHYYPTNNFYVYFRYSEKETVMVILNLNSEEKTLNTSRFAESLKGFTSAKEVMSGNAVNDLNNIVLPAKTSMILELK